MVHIDSSLRDFYALLAKGHLETARQLAGELAAWVSWIGCTAGQAAQLNEMWRTLDAASAAKQ